jgi:hypothetical protein
MAVINSKDETSDYLEQWKEEFRKCFNVYRVFNAHTANYAQRLELLESLKNIDPDWQENLDTVIGAFKRDWTQSIRASGGIITGMLQECLAHTITGNIGEDADDKQLLARMQTQYEKDIRKMETSAHGRIRSLFKHNIFNYDLPENSILHEDLFSESTWNILGLSRGQQIIAAGLGGAGIAAAVDAATFGASVGLFAALGGVAGATWAALGGRTMARTKILGLPLGGREIRIGPVRNIQFLYILLDRIMLYCAHISNWAHGRRDYDSDREAERPGYAEQWDSNARELCRDFFREVTTGDGGVGPETEARMQDFIVEKLKNITGSG